jgi:hypothetical protein
MATVVAMSDWNLTYRDRIGTALESRCKQAAPGKWRGEPAFARQYSNLRPPA